MLIVLLQDYNIILNPKHHNKHHANNNDINFCMLHGHTDFLLNYIWKSYFQIISRDDLKR